MGRGDLSENSSADHAAEGSISDSVIQLLFGVALQLEEIGHLVDERPSEAHAALEKAIMHLHGVIETVRRQREAIL